MTTNCLAIKQGDTMICARCGIAWSETDLYPPFCDRTGQGQSVVDAFVWSLIAIFAALLMMASLAPFVLVRSIG